MFIADTETPLRYTNTNWEKIVTPIRVKALKELLIESGYDKQKSTKLIDGFTRGFNIGYGGPTNRQDRSENIPLRLGSKTTLWNKVMAEVKENRYAGPYGEGELPFNNFIQSPIGLVLKDNGKKTRLIFHLSYDFGKEDGQKSVNFHTPDSMCSVKYRDLDHAVKTVCSYYS